MKKIIQKDKEEILINPEYGEIYANDKNFKVKFKNRGKFVKNAKVRGNKLPFDFTNYKTANRPKTVFYYK